jgi:hypothetical protein
MESFDSFVLEKIFVLEDVGCSSSGVDGGGWLPCVSVLVNLAWCKTVLLFGAPGGILLFMSGDSILRQKFPITRSDPTLEKGVKIRHLYVITALFSTSSGWWFGIFKAYWHIHASHWFGPVVGVHNSIYRCLVFDQCKTGSRSQESRINTHTHKTKKKFARFLGRKDRAM